MPLSKFHSKSTTMFLKQRGRVFSDMGSPPAPVDSYRTLSRLPIVSSAPRRSVHSRRDVNEEATEHTDDGYDSDATLDLDEALLSPLLQNTPPLQRMSREYERAVLHSLAQGKPVTYCCACSRDTRRRDHALKQKGEEFDIYDSCEIHWNDVDSQTDDDREGDYFFSGSTAKDAIIDWKEVRRPFPSASL